jgi:hypothetical protein
MIFELEPGERKLAQEHVRLVEDRRTFPGTLILTNRRAVITFARTPSIFLWALLWFVALIKMVAARAQRERVRHQIRRDRFASVEQGPEGIVVFHDQGEGYAHTSFAIKSDDAFNLWHQRMHRWAGATDDMADDPLPLPTARVIDR